MPSVGDQFALLFAAPIPFFLTVGGICVVLAGIIWKAMEWRYQGVIDRLRVMHEQAAAEAQYIGSRLADTKWGWSSFCEVDLRHVAIE
jgi:hypothetical protein